jgi:hypothetical protein
MSASSGVKCFQAFHDWGVDVAHGLVLLFGIGTKGPSIMGIEDEVVQADIRTYLCVPKTLSELMM